MTRTHPATKLAAAAGAIAAVLAICTAPSASQGGGGLEPGLYDVIQCAPDNRDAPDAEASGATGYDARSRCDREDDGRTLRIASTRMVTGGVGARISFTAPPSTEIVAVAVEANLRNSKGHHASLTMTDSEGRDAGFIASGGQAYDGWRTERWSTDGPGRARMVLRVTCDRDPCDQAPDLRAAMRNVRLRLRDLSPPELTRVSGSLVEGGWLTDEASLGVVSSDKGAGLSDAFLEIGGSSISTSPGIRCGVLRDGRALRVQPCPLDSEGGRVLPVAAAPFVEGENEIRVCVTDLTRQSACNAVTALVDSMPPDGYFGQQSAADPELVTVPVVDLTSGVSGGEIRFRRIGDSNWISLPTNLVGGSLQARVDSAAYPEGSYEFEATAHDVAGNGTTINGREDGSPMVVEFPLRESSVVRSRIGREGRGSTLGYGRSSTVTGVLLDSEGRPVPDREVTVTEYFGDGALVSERVRRVRTSGSGEFRSVLPNGPSRRVQVTYGGDEQYLPDSDSAGRLRVKSHATLRVSRKRIRAGDRVRFTGRVGRLGARMPPRGKLVELQVQERPGKFNTIRQAFTTNRRGKFRFKYRFGRFYTEPIRFRFKLKVVREQGWPYVAPVRSRARGLRIKPR